MYRVAVCDDEVAITSDIESRILVSSALRGMKTEIDIYYSGETLMQALKDGYQYDMIFLDIELSIKSGIEVGRFIRNELRNETVHIVYISANEKYALELFEIRPLHFLVKPFCAEKIDQVLAKGVELSNLFEKYFIYQLGFNRKKQNVKEILYFESINRQIKMVTTSETVQFYGTLSEIYDSLSDCGFIYIHKSYLVNYKYITEFQYSQVTMQDNTVLPISQSRRKEFRELQIELERSFLS